MAVKCILTGQTPSVLDGVTENVQTQINNKVDKVTGKGLSTNDYTNTEKTKLSGIETGAQKNTITGVKGNAETTYRTGNVNITATNIGLGNVNNTSDAEKPISTATQTALNGKQATITGAATTITDNNLTANRALISNSNGKVEVSSVTSTELGYLDGVTSNIQTQLNNKLSSAPVTSVNNKTGAVTLAKGDVGLGNVDNTSDANKPISNATQAALNDKQSKITVNGFLKGDGTGGITADKPIFYVTITGTVASPTADKTPAEIYQAYENGYAVYANVTLTGSSSSTNLKGLLPLTYVLAGIDAQYAITFSSISGKEIKEVCYSPAIRKWEVPYSGVIATKDDLSFTPESIGAQPKITAKGLLKGNGNGVVAAADETEVELVDLPIRAESIIIPKGRMRGDIDGDGKLTQNDADKIQQHIYSNITLTGADLWCADIDANNVVDLSDKTQIRRYLVGKPNMLTLTPTFADYYNSWTYVKVDDLTGYWTTEISIANLTTSNNVVVNICETFSMGQFYKAEVLTGKVKIYATTPPITDIPAIVVISSGSGKGSIPSYLNDSSLDHKFSLNLPTASWTGSDPYTQTVTISGSTANTKVDIQPSEELYDQLVADSVGYLAIKNVDGTLTAVTKGGKPSVDLTVQVTYNEVY